MRFFLSTVTSIIVFQYHIVVCFFVRLASSKIYIFSYYVVAFDTMITNCKEGCPQELHFVTLSDFGSFVVVQMLSELRTPG